MFDEKIDLFHLYVRKERNPRLALREVLSMAVNVCRQIVIDLYRSVRSIFSRYERPDFRNRKILFAGSYNNYEAIRFLRSRYPELLVVTTGGYVGKKIDGAIKIRRHLNSYGHWTKYLFLIYLAFKKNYRVRHYKLILKEYGFIDGYTKLLTDNKPQCVFISNDHYPAYRALILATRKKNVPCFYIQHASVTPLFPPMKASHALLYGEYSEDIYRQQKESDGVMIRVGNHRFDEYKQWISHKKMTGNIGVAYNMFDDIDAVTKLCALLLQHFNADKIIVRPHPLDKRTTGLPVQVSASKTESSLDYLKKLDVLISGNSSIILEAASMNVYSIQVTFGEVMKEMVDYYGFIRTGVATEVKHWEDLIPLIRSFQSKGIFDARNRIKTYDASVGEHYELDVQSHIVDVVNRILEEQDKK